MDLAQFVQSLTQSLKPTEGEQFPPEPVPTCTAQLTVHFEDAGPVAQATIAGGVGVHQYQLAVRKGDKLYLDVGCPEVIIQ